MNNILPKWSFLAKIQKYKAVKSMYIWLFIVPLLAKALIKIDNLVDLTIFNHQFTIQLGLPFSWKIFYFSAIFFSTANLIFTLRCYNLIKDHNNFSDFIDQGKGEIQLDNYAKVAGLSLEKIGFNKEDDESIYPQLLISEGKNLQDPFWTIYEKLNIARTNSRIICSILYALGFILISIILYQNTEAVFKMLL
jgi:hypothetical protein